MPTGELDPDGHSGSKSREGIETFLTTSRLASARLVTAGRKAEKALKPSPGVLAPRQAGVTAGRKAEKALKLTVTDDVDEAVLRHSGSKSREGIETVITHHDCITTTVTAGRKAEKALKPRLLFFGQPLGDGHSGSKSREGIETRQRTGRD